LNYRKKEKQIRQKIETINIEINVQKVKFKKERSKIMKRIILCLTAILLLFVACQKSCIPKRPKNLKSIDWENYNDVYTVVWNYKNECRGTEKDEDKDIMVYGWIHNFNGISTPQFDLCNNTDVKTPRIMITTFHDSPNEGLEILSKLDTCDLSKKCFIIGKLFFYQESNNDCCWVYPIIFLNSANNIYFE